MSKENQPTNRGLNGDLREIDSIYRMIIVAGLRSKQLLRGATPRIVNEPLKRRNISIALEEVRRGLVPFTIKPKEADSAQIVIAKPAGLSDSKAVVA
jgi:DNA-directed RNA polymerase omega subunit